MKARKLWIGSTIVVLAAALAAGCSQKKEERPAVVLEAAKGADEVKGVLGKEGGTLKFPDNGARLEIPANLLQEDITVLFMREKPSFDLSGKDFVGPAFRIGPKLTFAPGTARLYVPMDKPLPGTPADIALKMYYYDKLETLGPEGNLLTATWQPAAVAKFAGITQDQKYLMFDLHETISDLTTKPPFGLLQAAFDLPKP